MEDEGMREYRDGGVEMNQRENKSVADGRTEEEAGLFCSTWCLNPQHQTCTHHLYGQTACVDYRVVGKLWRLWTTLMEKILHWQLRPFHFGTICLDRRLRRLIVFTTLWQNKPFCQFIKHEASEPFCYYAHHHVWENVLLPAVLCGSAGN